MQVPALLKTYMGPQTGHLIHLRLKFPKRKVENNDHDYASYFTELSLGSNGMIHMWMCEPWYKWKVLLEAISSKQKLSNFLDKICMIFNYYFSKIMVKYREHEVFHLNPSKAYSSVALGVFHCCATIKTSQLQNSCHLAKLELHIY